MLRHMRRALALALLVFLGVAGCGGDDPSSTAASDSGSGQLVVSAASSLEPAFTAYADVAGIDAKQSFAGSDDLAAQIRQGVTPDVYAAANTSLPDDLYKDGLVEKPVVFATNTLVLAVPSDSNITSIEDLTGADVSIAIGQEGVPVGDYTREVLGRLPADESQAILDNVGSEEPDVASIVGKLTQGAVDAGFVYITDVTATDGALKAVDLPANLQPDVAYGAAVVTGANNPAGAKEFIDGLLNGDGADALKDAGFGPPPSG
jgi:molybdate transport system substrate-binding protein